MSAIGFALWVGLVGARIRLRRVRPRPVRRARGGGRDRRGRRWWPATSSMGTRRRSPRSPALAEPDLVRLDGPPPAARRPARLASLVLVAIVAVVLLAIGVEAFSRRDLGLDEPHPVAGLPGGHARSRRTDRPLVRRAPAAGPRVGHRRRRLRPRHGRGRAVVRRRAGEHLALDARDASRPIFPNIDLLAVPAPSCSSCSSSSASSWPGSRPRRSSPAGHRTRRAAGSRRSWRRRCRARAGRSPAGSASLRPSACSPRCWRSASASGSRSAAATSSRRSSARSSLGSTRPRWPAIGLAVGGLVRTSIAGEIVAALVIVTFLVDLVAPALKLPDWVHQLALTAHLGQPMVGDLGLGRDGRLRPAGRWRSRAWRLGHAGGTSSPDGGWTPSIGRSDVRPGAAGGQPPPPRHGRTRPACRGCSRRGRRPSSR